MIDKVSNFISCAQTPSTMNEARSLLDGGQHSAFVVLTTRQTAGRGRQGRVWQGAAGNLAMTLCWPMPQAVCDPRLSFVAGLAVQEVLQTHVKSDVQIKWPNDVLIDGRKASGILIETHATHILLGIGVNIVAHPPDLLATHLQAHGAEVTPEGLARQICDAFGRYYTLFSDQGFPPIRDLWRPHAAFIGAQMCVHSPITGKKICGVFIDVDFQGAAMLQCLRNNIVSIHSGDILPSLPD